MQQNQAPKFLSGLKTVVVRDGKHAEKAFAAAEVIIANGGVIFLSSRVQDVDLNFFAVQHDFLAVRVGFGRLVIFNKLDKQNQTKNK